MSGDIEGTKRVRDALDFTLKPVLDGFVEANMKAAMAGDWLHYASRSSGQEPNDPLDVYGLLKTVLDNWQEVFGDKFERKSMHKARRLFSQAFDARNTVAHLDLPLERCGRAELSARLRRTRDAPQGPAAIPGQAESRL